MDSIPIGRTTAAPRPVATGERFVSIAAGWRHACALDGSGAAFCWGENTRGQLGIGAADSAFHRVPVPVSGGERFLQLSVGGRYTCGITTDHRALCWGDNQTGQLGDSTARDRYAPHPVSGGLRLRSVYASSGFAQDAGVPLPNASQGGVAHTCALGENKRAYCWGWNGAGQVGNGSPSVSQFTPSPVAMGIAFDELGMGGAFTCGRAAGAVWCWGSGAIGQLGNGAFVSSRVPTFVGSPFAP